MRRRMELSGPVKRRHETENIREVVEMKMEGNRPRGRPKLRWRDTVRRDMKAWKIREEWATERSLQDPPPHTGRRRWKLRKWFECGNEDMTHLFCRTTLMSSSRKKTAESSSHSVPFIVSWTSGQRDATSSACNKQQRYQDKDSETPAIGISTQNGDENSKITLCRSFIHSFPRCTTREHHGWNRLWGTNRESTLPLKKKKLRRCPPTIEY